VALLFVLGVLIEIGLIERIKAGPHIGFALMCIAVGYLLRGIARAVWGREVLPMPRVFDFPPVILGDLVVTADALVIFLAVGVLLMLFFVFYRTSAGRIRPWWNAMAWTGVGVAMGAIGGVLVAPITLLHPDWAGFSSRASPR
jgi:branched-chain amino acid transport system permease protein